MTTRGKLITITGGNGTGKDSVAPLLAERMTAEGIPTRSIYGPRAHVAAAALQEIVLHETNRPASHLTQALTYFAVHAEAAESVLVPALEAGENIVLNRGPETTFIYNVIGRGLRETHPELTMLYERLRDYLNPDLVILLDAPVDIALARAAQQKTTDHIQEQARASHEERRTAYLELAKAEDWAVVDASTALTAVVDACWEAVQHQLHE